MHRGGAPKGYVRAGPVLIRLAFPVEGNRSMSFHDKKGKFATIARSADDQTGVIFVGGAHTGGKGEFKHRNDAGPTKGMTLILTVRADVTGKFRDLSPAEYLYALTGLAIFAP